MSSDVQPTPPVAESPPNEPLACCRPAGLLMFAAGGLVGGLLAAGILSAFFPFFEVPADILPSGMPSPEQIARADAADFRVNCLNGATTGAIYGAIAGLLLGIVGGRSHGSTGGTAKAAMVTALLAGVTGLLLGYLMPYVRSAFGMSTVETDLWYTIAVQACLLGSVGLAIGAGLALTVRPREPGTATQFIVGGLIGGLLAAGVYPVVAAFLFQGANTESTVPDVTTLQFLWLGAAGLLTGCFVAPRTAREEQIT